MGWMLQLGNQRGLHELFSFMSWQFQLIVVFNFFRQLALADIIIINKVDCVDNANLEELRNLVR